MIPRDLAMDAERKYVCVMCWADGERVAAVCMIDNAAYCAPCARTLRKAGGHGPPVHISSAERPVALSRSRPLQKRITMYEAPSKPASVSTASAPTLITGLPKNASVVRLVDIPASAGYKHKASPLTAVYDQLKQLPPGCAIKVDLIDSKKNYGTYVSNKLRTLAKLDKLILQSRCGETARYYWLVKKEEVK